MASLAKEEAEFKAEQKRIEVEEAKELAKE